MKSDPATLDLKVIRHDAHRIVLAGSQAARIVATVFFAVLAAGIKLSLPELRAAPWLFFGAALWQASGLLSISRLVVDLESRRLRWNNGRLWQPAIYDGPFNPPPTPSPESAEPSPEVSAARLQPMIRRHAGDPGLVTSKLRSRRLFLQLTLPQLPELRFSFGFPMGPAAAREQAALLAQSLGTEYVDAEAPIADRHPDSSSPL